MAQALVILPVCLSGSVVVVVIVIVSLSSLSPLPTPPTFPRQHRPHTPFDEPWGKGHVHGRGIPSRVDDGKCHFLSGVKKRQHIRYYGFLHVASPKAENWAMQSHMLVLPPCDCIARLSMQE